jgi:hypothetical protein
VINWPDNLVREIAERRVVFFVGSGISKGANPTLPTWKDLILNLVPKLPKRVDQKLVRKLVRREAFLDAAQILRDGIDSADFSAHLREIFQVRPTPPSSLYSDMFRMDPKVIVTTNYDEFIERNFNHYSDGLESHIVSKHDNVRLINDLRSPERSIIKIHGCISEPNNIVFDRVSYYNLKKSNPSLASILISLMTLNTVLFVGYSVNDPDIQLILEDVKVTTSGSYPHYALLSKFEHTSMRRVFLETYNISAIEYPDGNHGAVPAYLSILREKVEYFRSSRGIS